MSRKARQIAEVSQEDNASPKIWLANRGYSEYKPDIKTGRTRDTVVVLYHKSYVSEVAFEQHPLLTIGGILGKLLVQTEHLSIKNIVSVDISSLIPQDKYEEWMDEEGASVNLEKKISKPVCRVLEKMFLHNATIVAFGATCQLLLKVISVTSTSSDAGHRLTAENVSRIVLINPVFPTRCVNAQFRGTPSTFASTVRTDVIFSSETERDRRLPIIRSFFQKGESYIRTYKSFQDSLLAALTTVKMAGDQTAASSGSTVTLLADLDATNTIGETIWMSEVTITMNRNSKQYEQFASDVTRDMRDQFITNKKKNRAAASAAAAAVVPAGPVVAANKAGIKTAEVTAKVKFSADVKGDQIGGLVLRGNRCVLVRSLEGGWEGMRIPSVCATLGETPQQTAARSITELCDIDEDEFFLLPAIPPVTLYKSSGNVSVYVMYAVQPPPDGALEDQDTEDVDDLYDWYTWYRAVQAFTDVRDESSVLTMRSIACALAAASAYTAEDLVPRKWGGVFGQEWIASLSEKQLAPGKSVYGNMQQNVFKALPIMILVGAYGAGKTALLQNILGNQGSCQKIAVIVNTIAGVNYDYALLQQSGEDDEEKNDCSTFRLFDVNQCCVCCSGGGEMRQVLEKVAACGEYDYCIIEAAATADLNTLMKLLSGTNTSTSNNSSSSSNGNSGSYFIDNTVAVVDAANCLRAVSKKSNASAESNREAGMDSILYGQIRTAEVIVINKCDQLQSKTASGKVLKASIATIKTALRQLNAHATMIDTSNGDVDPSILMHTKRVQLRKTELSDLRGVELKDSNVGTWIFRSRKPFHPSRFDAAMRQMGGAIEGSDAHRDSAAILRINGYIWLANYPDNQGVLSYTRGHTYETTLGAPWWATMFKKTWPVGLEDAIRPLWVEPYGDRQIEIVLIGLLSDSVLAAVENILKGCLLTDDEFSAGQDLWNEMDDPFSFSWN